MPAAFAFHFVLLVVPTTLMGLSLPLLSRGVVRDIGEAAPVVSRLYAANTLGAAAGAAVGGWFLLGNLGFDGTVRLASSLNLVAAAVVLALGARRTSEPAGRVAPALRRRAAALAAARVWPWLALYAATGAAALALEVVYFRLVDGIMRSNSYTFAHVLTLYLVLFGAGAAAAGERARRSRATRRGVPLDPVLDRRSEPARRARALERAAAVRAAASARAVLRGRGLHLRLRERHRSALDDGAVFAHLLAPALVMGAPVFLMGYAYPFIAALVLRRESTLGRHTGALMACNILGNVAGSLLAGFVLLDALGTAGTLVLLAALLMALGVAAALRGRALACRAPPRRSRAARAARSCSRRTSGSGASCTAPRRSASRSSRSAAASTRSWSTATRRCCT